MSKMKFLDPKEAEKFKNKSGKCFVGHPVQFLEGCAVIQFLLNNSKHLILSQI